MGTFQQYQFQTIDRPLTAAEQQEINTWSSRAMCTSSSVTFTYHYGDFKKTPKSALLGYFDAFLYVANWGTRQLMFRFPRKAVDEKALKQFALVPKFEGRYIDFITKGDYIAVNIYWHDEEGGGDWIDDEEYNLGDYLAIREAILNGDYRALYLAWAVAVDYMDETKTEDDLYDDDEEERTIPAVPSGLNKMDAALTSFVKLFEIKDEIVAEAALKSGAIKASTVNYMEALSLLSAAEKEDFLKCLLQGEPRLDLRLKRRLEDLS